MQETERNMQNYVNPIPETSSIALPAAPGVDEVACSLCDKPMLKPRKAKYAKICDACKANLIAPIIAHKAPGRNDPCPCGKRDPVTKKPLKYKRCCLNPPKDNTSHSCAGSASVG